MGLPKAQLSAAEDMEVKTANYYYLQCLNLGELCWENGVPFSIEFPAKLGDYHVTLADLPSALALLQRKGVKLPRLDQRRLGGSSTKPSQFICFGIGWPSVGPLCNHPWIPSGRFKKDGTPILTPPHASAVTLSYDNKVDGKWKSASLAAYPAELCEFIAKALIDSNPALELTAPPRSMTLGQERDKEPPCLRPAANPQPV